MIHVVLPHLPRLFYLEFIPSYAHSTHLISPFHPSFISHSHVDQARASGKSWATASVVGTAIDWGRWGIVGSISGWALILPMTLLHADSTVWVGYATSQRSLTFALWFALFPKALVTVFWLSKTLGSVPFLISACALLDMMSRTHTCHCRSGLSHWWRPRIGEPKLRPHRLLRPWLQYLVIQLLLNPVGFIVWLFAYFHGSIFSVIMGLQPLDPVISWKNPDPNIRIAALTFDRSSTLCFISGLSNDSLLVICCDAASPQYDVGVNFLQIHPFGQKFRPHNIHSRQVRITCFILLLSSAEQCLLHKLELFLSRDGARRATH